MEKAKAFMVQRQSYGAKTRNGQTIDFVAAETGMTHLYAFNASDEGFVIVSANDCSNPILGYSDTGRFDNDNMPPALKRLLETYDVQMAGIGTRADDAISTIRSDIQPMLKSKWHQDAPFNNMIPTVPGGDDKSKRSPTGCVATAMAQVLYYYQWPKRTTRTITAYQDLPALAPVDFNWDAMQDVCNVKDSQATQDAVAALMQYCAYALRSNFGIVDTASDTEWLYTALYRYFSFDKESLSVVNRSQVDENEFFNIIYSELSEGRPVIMGGDSHEFVCDGYQSGEYYHMNWGWGGDNDGYFLLDSRTRSENKDIAKARHFPDDVLIGMKKTNNPYSDELNVQLTTGALQLASPTAGAYTRTGDTDFPTIQLLYAVQDYSEDTSDKTFDAGLALYKNGEFQKVLFEMKDVKVEDNTREAGRPASVTFGQGLADGSYDIIPVSRKTGSSQWLLNEDFRPTYINAVIAGDKMTLTVYPRSVSYVVNSITFEGKLVVGEPVKAIANVTNPNKNNIQTLIILNGGQIVGEDPELGYYFGGIPAGETKDLIFEFTPDKAGTWTCYLWNDKCFYGDGAKLVVKEEESSYLIREDIKLTCSAKTENSEKNGEENLIYGHVLNSVVTFKNPSADYAFSGKLEVTLALQGSRGDSIYITKITKHALIEPNGSYDIPVYYQGLQLGTSYALYGADNPDDLNLMIYYTPAWAISAYLADGTIQTDRNVTDYTVPEKALCIEFPDQGVTKITPNANPNCLYILSEAEALPQGITEKNVVRIGEGGNATADELELSDDYGFMTPMDFVAKKASYVRTFKSQECSGYTTLVLPFTATAITANGQPAALSLYDFTGDQPGKIYVSEVNGGMPIGGMPYLAKVADPSLAGQPVTFTGQNTGFISTYLALSAGNYQFVGNMYAKQDNTIEMYTFKEGTSGTTIPKQTACAGSRAYFKSLLFPGQYDTLTIDDNATAISTVKDKPSTTEAIYDLQGRRINGQPTRDIYIKDNRKIMIK